MTEEVWKHSGCTLAGPRWPAASRTPLASHSVQECAWSGSTASCRSGSYLGEVLGLSGCDGGARLTGTMLLPGCAATRARAGRLQGCGAQREIIEFMDICENSTRNIHRTGKAARCQRPAGGVQHLCLPALSPS